MSENPTVESAVEELKAPEKFDLADVLAQKVKYPHREVTVYLDAELAQQAYDKADEIADLNLEKAGIVDEADGTITGPDTTEVDAKIEAKTEELRKLVAEVEEGALTFDMRGVPPKLWRVIDATWRREIKPDSKDDEETAREKNIARNEKVNIDLVRNAITKITTSDGKTIEGLPPFDQVQALFDSLMETEWEKLRVMAESLTFANELFSAVSADADFLPKSSPGEATGDTSSQSE